MKIAFGMIVFEGDYVLKQCLDQVYPYASQILIAEGPVKFWQKQGRTVSQDDTNFILDNYPDPENKIKIVHGQFEEKDEQCRAYMQYVKDDIDYIWNLDSDEIYKTEDIEKIIQILKEHSPTSIGVRSCSFYGGFNHYLTGFELKKDNFLRIFKYVKGSTWLTHRPPTIQYPPKYEFKKKHINSDTLFNIYSIQMYHYSYVFPDQVYKKVTYYKDSVSKDNCIDNYFNQIYLPWVLGSNIEKQAIELKYAGVHEFKPHVRGECFTEKFELVHPEAIIKDIDILKHKFNEQLSKYK